MGSPTVALSDAAILTQVIDEALVSKGGKAHEQPSMVDLFAALQKVMELYAVDTHRAVKFKAILRVMHADSSMDWWQKLSQVDMFMSLSTSQQSVAADRSTHNVIAGEDDALSLSVLLNSDSDEVNGRNTAFTPSTIKRPATATAYTLMLTGGENLSTPLWERTPFSSSRHLTGRKPPSAPQLGQIVFPAAIPDGQSNVNDDGQRPVHMSAWLRRWRQRAQERIRRQEQIARGEQYALQQTFLRFLRSLGRIQSQREQQDQVARYWLQRVFDEWRSGMQRRNASLPALHMSCCIRVLAKFRSFESQMVRESSVHGYRSDSATLVRVWCRLQSLREVHGAFQQPDASHAQLLGWRDSHIAWLQESIMQLCQRHVLQSLFAEWSQLRPMRQRAIHHHRRVALATALSRLQANASFQRLLKRVDNDHVIIVDLRESAAITMHRRMQAQKRHAFHAWRGAHHKARVTTLRWWKFLRTVCFLAWKHTWHQEKAREHQVAVVHSQRLLKKYLCALRARQIKMQAAVNRHAAIDVRLATYYLKRAIRQLRLRRQAFAHQTTVLLVGRTHHDTIHSRNLLRFLRAAVRSRQQELQRRTLHIGFWRLQRGIAGRFAVKMEVADQMASAHALRSLYRRFIAKLWYGHLAQLQQRNLACWWLFRRWKRFHTRRQWLVRRQAKKLQLYCAALAHNQLDVAFKNWRMSALRNRRSAFATDRASTYHTSQTLRYAISIWKTAHLAKQASYQAQHRGRVHFNNRVLSAAVRHWRSRRERLRSLAQREAFTVAAITRRIGRQAFTHWFHSWSERVATTHDSVRKLKRGWAALACLRTVLLRAHAKSYMLGRHSTLRFILQKWVASQHRRAFREQQNADIERWRKGLLLRRTVRNWRQYCRSQRLYQAVTARFHEHQLARCTELFVSWRFHTRVRRFRKRQAKARKKRGWKRFVFQAQKRLGLSTAVRRGEEHYAHRRLQYSMAMLQAVVRRRQWFRSLLELHTDYTVSRALWTWHGQTQHALNEQQYVNAAIEAMNHLRMRWCIRQWFIFVQLKKHATGRLLRRKRQVFVTLKEAVRTAAAGKVVYDAACKRLLVATFRCMDEMRQQGQDKWRKLTAVRHRLLLLRTLLNLQTAAQNQRKISEAAAQVEVLGNRLQKRTTFAIWKHSYAIARRRFKILTRCVQLCTSYLQRDVWRRWQNHIRLKALLEEFIARRNARRCAAAFADWRHFASNEKVMRDNMKQVRSKNLLATQRIHFTVWTESFHACTQVRRAALRHAMLRWRQRMRDKILEDELVAQLRSRLRHHPVSRTMMMRLRHLLMWKAFNSLAQVNAVRLVQQKHDAIKHYQRNARRRALGDFVYLVARARSLRLCGRWQFVNARVRGVAALCDNSDRRNLQRQALEKADSHRMRRAFQWLSQRPSLQQAVAIEAAIEHHDRYGMSRALQLLLTYRHEHQEQAQEWWQRVSTHKIQRVFKHFVRAVEAAALRRALNTQLEMSVSEQTRRQPTSAQFAQWRRWFVVSQWQSTAIVRGLHAVFDIKMRRGLRALWRNKELSHYTAGCLEWANQFLRRKWFQKLREALSPRIAVSRKLAMHPQQRLRRYLQRWREYVTMRQRRALHFQSMDHSRADEHGTCDASSQTTLAMVQIELSRTIEFAMTRVISNDNTTNADDELPSWSVAERLSHYREYHRTMAVKYPASERFLRQHRLANISSGIRNAQLRTLQQQFSEARAQVFRIQSACAALLKSPSGSQKARMELFEQLQSTQHKLTRYLAILKSSEETAIHPRLIASMKQILADLASTYRTSWLAVGLQCLAMHREIGRYWRIAMFRRVLGAMSHQRAQSAWQRYLLHSATTFSARQRCQRAMKQWRTTVLQEVRARNFEMRSALRRGFQKMIDLHLGGATNRTALLSAAHHVKRHTIQTWHHAVVSQRRRRLGMAALQQRWRDRILLAAFQAWAQHRRASRMARVLISMLTRRGLHSWRDRANRRRAIAHAVEALDHHLGNQSKIRDVERLAVRSAQRIAWSAWRTLLLAEHRRCIYADISHQLISQRQHFHRWNMFCAGKANLSLLHRQAWGFRLQHSVRYWQRGARRRAEATRALRLHHLHRMFKSWRYFLQTRQHAKLDHEDSVAFYQATVQRHTLWRWRTYGTSKCKSRRRNAVAAVAHLRVSTIMAWNTLQHWVDSRRHARRAARYTRAMYLSRVISKWHRYTISRQRSAVKEAWSFRVGMRRRVDTWHAFVQRRRELSNKRAIIEANERANTLHRALMLWHRQFDHQRSLRAGLRLLRAVYQNERAQEEQLMVTAATYHRHKAFSRVTHRVFLRIACFSKIDKVLQRHQRRRRQHQLREALERFVHRTQSRAIVRRAEHKLLQLQRQKLRATLSMWCKYCVLQRDSAELYARADNIRRLFALRAWRKCWMEESATRNKNARALKHRRRVLLAAVFSAWWSCTTIS